MSLAGDDLIAWLKNGADAASPDPAKRELAERLGAFYLARCFSASGQPLDPVARFHLGNGAHIERINWQADCSSKGMSDSLGLMVNYQYQLGELNDNLARLRTRQPRLGRLVSRLLLR